MLSLTLIYALFTILGVGSILNPLLRKCGVTRLPDEEAAAVSAEASVDDSNQNCCQNFKKWLVHFNRTKFGPVFIKDDLKNRRDVARLDGDAAEDKTKVRVNETVEEIKDDMQWNEVESPGTVRMSNMNSATSSQRI